MGRRIAPYRLTALAVTFAASTAILGSSTLAEIAEAEGGMRADAGLDFRLQFDDGDPEFRTGFNFDLATTTRTRQLSFSGDFGVLIPLDDLDEVDFDDPRYGINYLRDTGRLRLALGADYSRREIDDRLFNDTDLDFDEENLNVIEGGFEERRGFDAALEIGVNDPIGAEVRYSFDDRIYTDSTDPDLEDTVRQEASAALRFDADRTLRFGVSTQWTLEEEEGLIDERDERFRAGVDVLWQARPVLELSAEIAYAQIEVENTIGGVTVGLADRDGINLRFGLGLDRPNGGYRFAAARILHAPGFVNTVDLSRGFELARGAQVNVRLGATELPSGDVYGTGGFTYDRELQRGEMVVSYTHTATLNGDFDEVRRNILQGSYNLALGRDAQLAFSGRLTDSEFLQGAAPDVESAQLSLNYRRPLSEQWDLGAGATWRVTREDGADENTDSTLFLSVERRFSLRN